MTSVSSALGQGWPQVLELAVALILSASIGAEREIRQKSAGLRTHTLVGFAAALIMLVSKYGFAGVLGEHVVLDPSRVAAQIVSGIGFIGGGLIFVRRDAVRGLTTAATIWLVAAVGMAAGGGLWLLAVLATAGYFVVMLALTPLAGKLPRSKYSLTRLRLSYHDGQGVLRRVLAECTRRGFGVGELMLDQDESLLQPRLVSVLLSIQGRGSVPALIESVADMQGVVGVSTDDSLASGG